jgi:hypothetical protein
MVLGAHARQPILWQYPPNIVARLLSVMESVLPGSIGLSVDRRSKHATTK